MICGIFDFRIMIFKFFYDSLLLSILKGWSLAKPRVRLDSTTTRDQWKDMKREVAEWIDYYRITTVSNGNLPYLVEYI